MSWGSERNDDLNWIIECEDEDQGLMPGSVVHLKSKLHQEGKYLQYTQPSRELAWGEKDAELAWVIEFPPGIYSGQFVHLQSGVNWKFWRGQCDSDEGNQGFCWEGCKTRLNAWLIETDDASTTQIGKGACIHLKSLNRVLHGGEL